MIFSFIYCENNQINLANSTPYTLEVRDGLTHKIINKMNEKFFLTQATEMQKGGRLNVEKEVYIVLI